MTKNETIKPIKKSAIKEDIQRAALAGISSIIAGITTHPIDTVKIKT
jgi:hypothetical protein